ncbi:GH12340 [Drosophila grimshawi]|uniref:GH12340 n=1 Tax=Drosophila grimshawi TaxID=7222 RepID=B4JJ39_DROGR|nr:GH12340 [Drosophila grimshawi]
MAHIAYMGITFIIILPILAANGNPTRSSVHKKVGDECQFLNFTESYCELGERCSTLETFVNDGIIALEEIPTCGFMDPTSSEMLCCPSQRSISSFPQAPKQINLDQMPNARSATLCIEEEAKGASNLYAVGFAQGVDGNNCDLFTTPLVLSDDCSLVQATRRVEGFDIPGMHLCVKPISGGSHSRQMDSCSKCLTASSSVLHVQRTDGSFCVAGIATPTTNKCVVNNNSIYYTSVVNSDARMFHGKYEKFTYRHRENDGSFGTP